MRLLLISAEFPAFPGAAAGGVAGCTAMLAAALAARGHVVSVLTSARSAPDTGHEQFRGFVVDRAIEDWGWRGLPRILRKIRAFAPDVVNFQYVPQIYGRAGVAPAASLLPLLIRARLGLRVICTVHEAFAPFAGSPRQRIASAAHRIQLRVILASRSILVTTNPAYATRLRERAWAGQVIHEIPIGATFAPVAMSAAERQNVRDQLGAAAGLIGDVSPAAVNRRPCDLVEVLPGLHPSVRLIFIGVADRDREAAAAAMTRAAEIGVGDRILDTGTLDQRMISRYLGALDVCVHTAAAGASTRSTSLAAALSHGVPVVAYRGPETAPFLLEGEGIVVVDNGDIAAMTSAVRAILESDELRREMAAGARRVHAAHLDWDVIADQLLAVAV